MDGNKRTAIYLAEVLAAESGYRLTVDDGVLADIVTDVARGELGYDALATWFEARLEPVASSEPRAYARGTESPDDQ